MTPAIQKILKSLVKELKSEIASEIRRELRESLEADIVSIVKEVMNSDDLKNSINAGWLTIADLGKKYHISRKTISLKCNLFKVARKQVGRHNLVNETEFLAAHDKPMERPKFLNRQYAIKDEGKKIGGDKVI